MSEANKPTDAEVLRNNANAVNKMRSDIAKTLFEDTIDILTLTPHTLSTIAAYQIFKNSTLSTPVWHPDNNDMLGIEVFMDDPF